MFQEFQLPDQQEFENMIVCIGCIALFGILFYIGDRRLVKQMEDSNILLNQEMESSEFIGEMIKLRS